MIVDSHVHAFHERFFPPAWFEAKAAEWSGRTWPPRDPADIVDRIEPRLVDSSGTGLVADMRAVGIDRAVCIGLDPGVFLGGAGDLSMSDRIEGQAAPHSLHIELEGFVGIDPRRSGARTLLRSAVENLGFRGLKIYTPHGYGPTDAICTPLYEECLELGIPVMYHTAVVAYPLQSHYANPLLIQGVQHRFPDLTIILGHAGHPIWLREAALVCQGHPRTFVEVSGWQRHLDDSTQDAREALQYLRKEVGAHRMLFGSDHFAVNEAKRNALARWVEFAASVDGFGSDERELFLGGNMLRLLGH